MKFLQPPGWAPARGYANGVAARGTQIFVGGQIGWNAAQQFESDDFIAQTGQALRQTAQQWLQQTGYAPKPIAVDSHLTKLVAGFVPLVHLDDHPEETRFGMQFQTSLPTDIESWVRTQAPGARRLEFCHDTERIVVREGWQVMGDACSAQLGDRVQRFAH